MKKLIAIILFFGIITNGCVTYSSASNSSEDNARKIMNSWMGSTMNIYIMEHGTPDSTSSDGNGGKVLYYELAKSYQGVYAIHKKYIYFNSKKLMYHWRYAIQGSGGEKSISAN